MIERLAEARHLGHQVTQACTDMPTSFFCVARRAREVAVLCEESFEVASPQRSIPVSGWWLEYPESDNSREFEVPLWQYCPYAVDIFDRRAECQLASQLASPIAVGVYGSLNNTE